MLRTVYSTEEAPNHGSCCHYYYYYYYYNYHYYFHHHPKLPPQDSVCMVKSHRAEHKSMCSEKCSACWPPASLNPAPLAPQGKIANGWSPGAGSTDSQSFPSRGKTHCLFRILICKTGLKILSQSTVLNSQENMSYVYKRTAWRN